MSALTVKVDVLAGVDCREAIHEMCQLASHMRVPVEATMNGVTVRAIPFCDSKELCDAWDAELLKPERPFKFVMGKRFGAERLRP